MEATPETRFAPELLCASAVRGARISAAIAAVVVFPFVAETSAEPSGSRAASRSTAAGIDLPEQLARQGRAAAAAGEPREGADRACAEDLDAQRQPRAHCSRVSRAPLPIARTSESQFAPPSGG